MTPQKKIPVAIIRDEMTYAVREGCYSQIIQTWTTGSFLTAYALVLGANNLIIGLLAAVPFLANVAQTPVTFMIEKYRKRKILTLFFGACNFPLLLLMASFVFFKPSEATAWGLFLCVFLRFFCAASVVCVWNSWMRDYVPWRLHSKYYVSRLKQMTVAVILCNLAGALIVDAGEWVFPKNPVMAYPLLYLAAGLAAGYAMYCVYRVTDKEMAPRDDDAAADHLGDEIRQEIKDRWRDLKKFSLKIKEPFKNLNFRRLMIFFCLFNFGVNLISPFFAVVLLNVMGFPLVFVIGMVVLSQFTGFCFMSLWETTAKEFNYKSVLRLSASLYMLAVFLWLCIPVGADYFVSVPMLILVYALLGVATSGVNVSTYNLALSLAPAKTKMGTYQAASNTLNALSAGFAPIIGGLWADFFKHIELSVIVQWKTASENLAFKTMTVTYWGFFFLFSIAFAGISLLFLAKVEVSRDANKKQVAAALIELAKRSWRQKRFLVSLRTKIRNVCSSYEQELETKKDSAKKAVKGVKERIGGKIKKIRDKKRKTKDK